LSLSRAREGSTWKESVPQIQTEVGSMRTMVLLMASAGFLVFVDGETFAWRDNPGPAKQKIQQPSIQSPRLLALYGELEHGNKGALEKFWKELQARAPLVEPVAGANGEEYWVTYIWRGDKDTRHVYLIGGAVAFSAKELNRLLETNLWYYTERMPKDARYGYSFMVSPRPQKMPNVCNDPLAARTYAEQSVVELPGAPTQPWSQPMPEVPQGKREAHKISSTILKSKRAVTVYTPAGYDPAGADNGLLVVFDGESCGGDLVGDNPIPGHVILDNLIAKKRIPPMVVLFVESGDTRDRDLGCSEPFVDFLAKELLPWTHAHFRVSSDPARTVVAGFSRGGLAAAYCGLRHPEFFGNVLALSGAFWWYPEADADRARRGEKAKRMVDRETGWLTRQFVKTSRLRPVRFYIAAGSLEVGPVGGIRPESRRLRDVLEAKAYQVTYHEYIGDHDYVSWRGLLADGLLALVGTSPAEPSKTQGEKYRRAALDAGRWIRSTTIMTDKGAAWPAVPGDAKTIGTGLYDGVAGIVLYFLEAHHVTKDQSYLNDARAGADYLLNVLEDEKESGLYEGLAGIGFTLQETFKATGDARYRDGAKRCVQFIQQRAKKVGNGVEWSDVTDIISGSAGTGLFLLYAARELGDQAARDLAAAAGKRLIELGRPAAGGLKWAMTPKFDRLMPNFSHGTAGVAYFLASLYLETKDDEFRSAALAGAKYLKAIAKTDGDVCLVFHHEPKGEDLFYLGWCHGPTGTARLFYRLYQATQDRQWLDWVKRSAGAVTQSGVPEKRTPGFWNNVSQCCGSAGVAEFFLDLNRITHDRAQLAFSRRVADDLLQRGTRDETGLRWVQAEHRIQPDLLVAQTGYMQGAAGIGMMLFHQASLELGQKKRITLPDCPF
jgi:enterochelin esterase-like enzyme/rhamnogalacturonyl hydrolase YesR